MRQPGTKDQIASEEVSPIFRHSIAWIFVLPCVDEHVAKVDVLMLDEFKKTLSNVKDQSELLHRLAKVRRDSPPRFGTMTAHQMICHLSDSFRSSLGEKFVSPSSNLLKRTIYKWIALWAPLPWPVGVRTRPEMDQRLNGTKPVDFDSDSADLRILFERFCHWEGPFAAHAILGPLSRTERMRHAYLHIDHHLRQFGA